MFDETRRSIAPQIHSKPSILTKGMLKSISGRQGSINQKKTNINNDFGERKEDSTSSKNLKASKQNKLTLRET
jgi:hypothetical protein